MFTKAISDGTVLAEPAVSIVVPFYNEEQTLAPLCQKIADALDGVCPHYEILFVNDGSTDGSEAEVCELIRTGEPVRLISFRRNFGKSAALSSGFNAARGAIVISMDADLQDDPAEIPRFLTVIGEGADVVSGWKQVRHDPVGKTLPSRLFNAVVNKAFGLDLKDHNCGFKAYRAEALRELNLYGELHRFIPALLFARGFRIAQLPVEHHPRRFGKSKFGSRRLVKGALDLMTVWLNTRYGARPLHMFGGGALFYLLLVWPSWVIFLCSGSSAAGRSATAHCFFSACCSFWLACNW